MDDVEREARQRCGDPPGPDPLARFDHLLRVFAELDDEHPLKTATIGAYADAPWTGVTWGDLRAIVASLHAASEAMTTLAIINDKLGELGAPRRHDSGRELAPLERLDALLAGAFQPRRGDAVERWLERKRDEQERVAIAGDGWGSYIVECLLERYRECSDYGLTLEACDEGRGGL